LISLLWMLLLHTTAQVVSFSHLNTSNGLSDNYVQSLVIDKNGFLWTGTADGLNMYDGYTITSWFKSSQTGLPSDTIRQLYCDSRNRIWVTTPGQVAWAGEDKKFHAVVLPGKKELFTCHSVFETTNYGVILFTANGHFYFNETKKQWEKIGWLSETINNNRFNTAVAVSKDRGAYVYEQKIIVVDYKTQKIILEKNIPNAVTACRYNDNAIAVATRHGNVSVIDIATQQDLKTYYIYNENDGKKSSPRVTEMIKASDGSLAIATVLAGLSVIDSTTGSVNVYKHDPLNSASVSANVLYRVFCGKDGDLVVGTQSSGVSICNINNKTAVYKKLFRDTKGNIFDGHINTMAEDKDGFLWITALDRLIRWDKKNNISTFYQYFFNDPALGPRYLETRTLCIDKKERMWVSAVGAGVALFDKKNGTFRLVTKDTSLGPAVRNNYVNALMEDSEGNIWAGSFGGMYLINPGNHHITVFYNHPLLKELNEKVVISFCEDNEKRIWIGTQRFGVYCYDRENNSLTNYTVADGLLNSTASSLVADRYGNIYTTHLNGFSVIAPDGKIRNFSKANGMRYPRCESILTDDNYVWIANNKCLVRYNPSNNQLEYFEENAGISTDGFRFDAACKSRDGVLYFGTHRGINYFNPSQIKNNTAQLRVNIYQVTLPDSVIRFDNSQSIKTGFAQNSVQFNFTAINLTGSRNIAYQYMLEGFDKDWQKGNDIHFARYPSLPSGKYIFKVKASIDKINWVNAGNEIALRITPPLWKRWWFIAVSVVLLLAIIIGIVQFRINRIRYKERLKTIYNKKISETEMKALRAQMNPHFIFNSLNSINKYILKSDHATASRYLTRFAKLIRLILDNSNSKEVALSNELEALKLYIEMEALRFTNKFSYEIKVDDNVSADTLQVPPLIIQPYVENAIWHGLLHKETDGRLSVSVRKTNSNMLECIIEDNGVGRIKANELKSKSATTGKSLGMKLTEERIAMLNQYASLNASIQIIDLENGNGEAAGTKVILTIPI